MGLTFSNTNGAITGTPTTITQLSSVTISASNPDKVTQVTLTFSVNVYKCNADGVWPETEVGADLHAGLRQPHADGGRPQAHL